MEFLAVITAVVRLGIYSMNSAHFNLILRE